MEIYNQDENTFFVLFPGVAHEVRIKYLNGNFEDELQRVILKLLLLRANKQNLSRYTLDLLAAELGFTESIDMKVLKNVVRDLNDSGKINIEDGLISISKDIDDIESESSISAWLFYDFLNQEFIDFGLIEDRLELTPQQDRIKSIYDNNPSITRNELQKKIFHKLRIDKIDILKNTEEGYTVELEGDKIRSIFLENRLVKYPLYLPVTISYRYDTQPMYIFGKPVIDPKSPINKMDIDFKIESKLIEQFPEIYKEIICTGENLNLSFLEKVGIDIYKEIGINDTLKKEAEINFYEKIDFDNLKPLFKNEYLKTFTIDAEIRRIQGLCNMNLNNEVNMYLGYIFVLHILLPLTAKPFIEIYKHKKNVEIAKNKLKFFSWSEVRNYITKVEMDFNISFSGDYTIDKKVFYVDDFLGKLNWSVNKNIIEFGDIIRMWIFTLFLPIEMPKVNLCQNWIVDLAQKRPNIFYIADTLIKHRNDILKNQRFPKDKISVDDFRNYVYILWKQLNDSLPDELSQQYDNNIK